MSIDLFHETGIPLDEQTFTWRDLVRTPISKVDIDAFTRVRIILMNGVESEQNSFLHALARMDGELSRHAAVVRRVEQHQQTLVNWLTPADQSVLETTIAFEQAAIEVTASIARAEPDPYLAQVYRFGLLEDLDHLYRFSALMERTEGRDANSILQDYTDILPGRATGAEHRHPLDDLREPYDRIAAVPLSKMHALTLVAGKNQSHDYYMTVGPTFADPIARQLYAEIASIEEQHVTQYESVIDPTETRLEKWLLHECNEVYNYWSCSVFEDDARLRRVWDRFVEYELGHLHFVMELFERIEGRDPAEVLPRTLPVPIQIRSHRTFVREVAATEVGFTARRTHIGQFEDSNETLAYRDQLNSEGSPSEQIAADYR